MLPLRGQAQNLIAEVNDVSFVPARCVRLAWKTQLSRWSEVGCAVAGQRGHDPLHVMMFGTANAHLPPPIVRVPPKSGVSQRGSKTLRIDTLSPSHFDGCSLANVHAVLRSSSNRVSAAMEPHNQLAARSLARRRSHPTLGPSLTREGRICAERGAQSCPARSARLASHHASRSLSLASKPRSVGW